MKHPISESSLKRFAGGTASREEGKMVLAHLLRGCSACSRKLRELMGPLEHNPGYNEVLDRLEESFLSDLPSRAASTHRLGRLG